MQISDKLKISNLLSPSYIKLNKFNFKRNDTIHCLLPDLVEFRLLMKGSSIIREPFATTWTSPSALPLQHSSSVRLTTTVDETHISCWIVARIGFGSSIASWGTYERPAAPWTGGIRDLWESLWPKVRSELRPRRVKTLFSPVNALLTSTRSAHVHAYTE